MSPHAYGEPTKADHQIPLRHQEGRRRGVHGCECVWERELPVTVLGTNCSPLVSTWEDSGPSALLVETQDTT